MDQLAACVHFGITRNSDTSLEGNMGPENDYEVRHVYTPLQLGVGAQWSVARFWLLPWIGVDERALAFGIGAGADVYIDSSGHRIGAYLDAAGSREECTSVVTCGNLYVSAGIAYRYW